MLGFTKELQESLSLMREVRDLLKEILFELRRPGQLARIKRMR